MMRRKYSCLCWVISAAKSVDGMGKVTEERKSGVLTFRTGRLALIMKIFLMRQN